MEETKEQQLLTGNNPLKLQVRRNEYKILSQNCRTTNKTRKQGRNTQLRKRPIKQIRY